MTREYSDTLPSETRTAESLKRKFASLHRKTMPTGDLLMLAEVRRVKHIRSLTSDRAEMGNAEDAEATTSETFDASTDKLNDTDGILQLELRFRDVCSLETSSDTACTTSPARGYVIRVSRPHRDEQPPPQAGNVTPSTPNPVFPCALVRHRRANSNHAGSGEVIILLVKILVI